LKKIGAVPKGTREKFRRWGGRGEMKTPTQKKQKKNQGGETLGQLTSHLEAEKETRERENTIATESG